MFTSTINIEARQALEDCKDQIPSGAKIVAELGIDLEQFDEPEQDRISLLLCIDSDIELTTLGKYYGPDPSQLAELQKAYIIYSGENLNVFWYEI